MTILQYIILGIVGFGFVAMAVKVTIDTIRYNRNKSRSK